MNKISELRRAATTTEMQSENEKSSTGTQVHKNPTPLRLSQRQMIRFQLINLYRGKE